MGEKGTNSVRGIKGQRRVYSVFDFILLIYFLKLKWRNLNISVYHFGKDLSSM